MATSTTESTPNQLPFGEAPIPLTFPYYTYTTTSHSGSAQEHTVYLDLYLPNPTSKKEEVDNNSTKKEIPFVIFFHGGNLLFGSRKSIPAPFLIDTLDQEFAFISVSYRLLLPCTGFDILEDVFRLLGYIFPTESTASTPKEGTRSINEDISKASPDTPYRLSQKTYFVSGYSAGAYLARTICLINEILPPSNLDSHYQLNTSLPSPTAAFLLSGQGGDWFIPQYIFPKANADRQGHAYDKFLYLSEDLTPQQQFNIKGKIEIVSEFNTYSENHHEVMNVMRKQNVRMGAAMAFYQLGAKLDYLTGISGLSNSILNKYFIPSTDPSSLPSLKDLVPEEARVLFPEIYLENPQIAGKHCPVYIIHGTGDKTVRISEAERTARQLKQVGVHVRFIKVKGWGHIWMNGIWERYAKGEKGVMSCFKMAMLLKKQQEEETKKEDEGTNRKEEGTLDWSGILEY